MIKIMTGVASTCGSIASLNRLARCSGSTRSVNVPFAPSGIWRIQSSPICPALHLRTLSSANRAPTVGGYRGTYDFPGDDKPEYPISITKGQAEAALVLTETPDTR